ncbi:MAG: DUF3426 domain-containing protein [Mariprofundaceae bacterium]|nr:DUF3426 domain-containing protein [Mariprofundaceae bacterium]
MTTADKPSSSRQHAHMRILCPHCQAIYQLPAVDADTLLVCHRCNSEFRIGEQSDGAPNEDSHTPSDEATPGLFVSSAETSEAEQTTKTPPAVEEQAPARVQTQAKPAKTAPETAAQPEKTTAPTSAESRRESPPSASAIDHPVEVDAEKALLAPPPRSKARIMPWLFTMLVVIAGSGFWFNHDAWLDDPWLRSVLLNIGAPVQLRDKDWFITPDSVDATWIKRSQNNTVLVITGEVVNRLQTDLPPPAIHFTLYARDNPDAQILERDLTITRPPLMQAIRKTPFTPPPPDTTPVSALGKRGFVLVLENMPQNAGNFTLSPAIR